MGAYPQLKNTQREFIFANHSIPPTANSLCVCLLRFLSCASGPCCCCLFWRCMYLACAGSWLQCTASHSGAPLLWGTGPRHTGSVVAARRLFLNQGSNLCPPCRQADSKPVHPQGSPTASYTCFINQSVQLLFVEGLGLPWSLRW